MSIGHPIPVPVHKHPQFYAERYSLSKNAKKLHNKKLDKLEENFVRVKPFKAQIFLFIWQINCSKNFS